MYKNPYVSDQNRLSEGRLPARTLLLPASKCGVTHKNYTESDRVQSLDGDWRFAWLGGDTDEAFFPAPVLRRKPLPEIPKSCLPKNARKSSSALKKRPLCTITTPQ